MAFVSNLKTLTYTMKATKILSSVILLLCATACTLGDRDQTPRPENIGAAIARTAVAHLHSANTLLNEILLYDQMLAIEEESERNTFRAEHFEKIDSITINGNLHEVYHRNYSNPTRITTDGNTLSNGGNWRVTMKDKYDFTIQANSDSYTLEISKLIGQNTRHNNLTGKIIAKPREEGGFSYSAPEGLLSVGNENTTYNDGKRYPLNIYIDITEDAVYNANSQIFIEGAINIRCEDTLYGTTDLVSVKFNNSIRVEFTYLIYNGYIEQRNMGWDTTHILFI